MPQFSVADGTDFKMNYEIAQQLLPETTLFIHGNLASNRWWHPAQEDWAKKGKGRSLPGSMIMAEFRGCGNSSAPKSLDEVTVKRLAQDFIDLLHSMKSEPVHLVGHSTGGLIAAQMMAMAPQLFKKAVLLDPVGATGVQFDEKMIAAFEQMKVDRSLVAAVIGSTIHKNNSESDFFQQVIVEDAFKAAKTVGYWILKALDRIDLREEIQTVSQPTLVLHGEHDYLLSIEESKKLAALMKHGQFQVIKDHGHCMNVEDASSFVKIVNDFLFPNAY